MSMAPTKDELEKRVAALEQENEELRAGAGAEDGAERDVSGTGRRASKPQRPVDADGKPQLSEGERQALVDSGVTTSPFTGEELNALDEGVEPASPQARKRAERAKARKAESVPDSWPVAGSPPAEGGRTDLAHEEPA